MTNVDLARQAARVGRQHPACSPGRRAAGMAYAALVTTKTPEAASRALSTFGDPFTRPAAAALLDELQREAA